MKFGELLLIEVMMMVVLMGMLLMMMELLKMLKVLVLLLIGRRCRRLKVSTHLAVCAGGRLAKRVVYLCLVVWRERRMRFGLVFCSKMRARNFPFTPRVYNTQKKEKKKKGERRQNVTVISVGCIYRALFTIHMYNTRNGDTEIN